MQYIIDIATIIFIGFLLGIGAGISFWFCGIAREFIDEVIYLVNEKLRGKK